MASMVADDTPRSDLSYLDDAFNHPSALVLSICARIFIPFPLSLISNERIISQIVITTAMNSSKLTWIRSQRAGGMVNLQPTPHLGEYRGILNKSL